MQRRPSRRGNWRQSWSLVVLSVLATGGLLVGGISCTDNDTGSPGASPTSSSDASDLVLLSTNPETGPVGTPFVINGGGLPPATSVEVVWGTRIGSYRTELNDNRQEFYERQFAETREVLGTGTVGPDGRFELALVAPEDFGGAHDIYLVANGAEVAKGGFWIERRMVVEPLEGPVGTPITVTVTGLGWKAFESTGAIRWDNRYTGFVTATTTRGTARAQLRAAGPEGDHLIELYGASHTLPYLNVQQSPVAFVGVHRATFRVTKGGALPEARADWPDLGLATVDASTPRTTVGTVPVSSDIGARLSAASGAVMSSVRIEADDLSPGRLVDQVWVTVTGNDLFGWALGEEPLGQATVDASGHLVADVQIPESLGGWHAIRLVSDGDILAELPYFVERSLVGASPQRVKAGETFTVQLKGVGWTELDNGVAVTYDNGYIGYACGFASKGDVTIELVATGGPGVHLIDLYPMIYDGGHGKWPWQYNVPQLTYAQDHPSLGLGYRLPAFRVAIEVVR